MNVAVLDGGIAKWTKEGRPATPDVPEFSAVDYPLRLNGGAAVGARMVHRRLGQQLLLDARAPARYRGEQEPIDPVAGRIPGARNRFNMDNVAADGTFKPPQELKQAFQQVLGNRAPGEVVNYCGSGVAACHNLLAMEVAGLAGRQALRRLVERVDRRSRRARRRKARSRKASPGLSTRIFLRVASSGAQSVSSAKSWSEPTLSANERCG